MTGSIPLSFPPYRHQEKAYERLQPGSPQNTLVATGTGSGKTESFLLPVLEHCRQQLAIGQKGIKAILIYQMNALATDQAKPIAQLVGAADAHALSQRLEHIIHGDIDEDLVAGANPVVVDRDDDGMIVMPRPEACVQFGSDDAADIEHKISAADQLAHGSRG